MVFDYSLALGYAQRLLEVRQAWHNGNNADVANSLYHVGALCWKLGKDDQCLEYSQMALKMRGEIFPRDHPDIASSLRMLGFWLQSVGKYDEALEHQQRALEMRQAVYGNGEHQDVAQSLSNLGTVRGCLDEH